MDGLEKYSIHLRSQFGYDQIVKVETDNSIKYRCTPLVASVPTLKPKVVEFIFEDNEGKELLRTREIPLKNFGSTIYVGPNNPKKADGKRDSYVLPPINSLDAAAKKHDLSYDLVQAKGFKGAILDTKTLDADKQLILDASNVIAMYHLGITDPINRQQVSVETKDAAVKVVGIFTNLVAEKTIRSTANKVGNYVEKKAQSAWETITTTIGNAVDKANSTVNKAVKEGERMLTPTLPQ